MPYQCIDDYFSSTGWNFQPKCGNGAPNNASSQTKNYEITHGLFLFQGDGEIILFEPFPVFLGGPKEAAINIIFRQVSLGKETKLCKKYLRSWDIRFGHKNASYE
jgi:hypothetical protein